MKTELEIYAVLTDIFQELFDDDKIVLSADTTAEDIEGWDSFNHMNIIIATEAKFGIKIDFAEIEELQRVGDLVQAIIKKLQTV
jgi:acyl carrier protein